MSSSNPIDDLVGRFVADILDILDRARAEALAVALRTLGAPQPARAARRPKAGAAPANTAPKPAATGRTARRPPPGPGQSSTPSATRRHAGPTPAPAAPVAPRGGPTPQAAPAAAPGRTTARVRPQAAPPPAAPPQTASAGAASPEAQDTGREALVVEAVRSLVRATASEVAQRTGLPNGSVYVLLRALVGAGRVAKTDSMRGVEYSLVSSGSVRPFRRTRATAPGAAEAVSHDGEGRGAAAPVVGREADAEGGELALGAPAGEAPGVVAPALA